MKRYHVYPVYLGDGLSIESEEYTDGEWVRAEDALKLQAVVDAAVPRCEDCERFATKSDSWGRRHCDNHARPDSVDTDYAEALRALEKP